MRHQIIFFSIASEYSTSQKKVDLPNTELASSFHTAPNDMFVSLSWQKQQKNKTVDHFKVSLYLLFI